MNDNQVISLMDGIIRESARLTHQKNTLYDEWLIRHTDLNSVIGSQNPTLINETFKNPTVLASLNSNIKPTVQEKESLILLEMGEIGRKMKRIESRLKDLAKLFEQLKDRSIRTMSDRKHENFYQEHLTA